MNPQQQTNHAIVSVLTLEPGSTGASVGTAWFLEPSALGEEGLLVTNAHVASTPNVFIRLPSSHEEALPVTVVGVSRDYDVALLRPTLESLNAIRRCASRVFKAGADKSQHRMTDAIPSLSVGSSANFHPSTMAYGDVMDSRLWAIGYPLDSYAPQVTMGNFSGLTVIDRKTWIQHDVTINPGNSGGPLMRITPEATTVVGMNTLQRREVQNTNFAISIEDVMRVVRKLYDHGEQSRAIKEARSIMLAMYSNQTDRHEGEVRRASHPGILRRMARSFSTDNCVESTEAFAVARYAHLMRWFDGALGAHVAARAVDLADAFAGSLPRWLETHVFEPHSRVVRPDGPMKFARLMLKHAPMDRAPAAAPPAAPAAEPPMALATAAKADPPAGAAPQIVHEDGALRMKKCMARIRPIVLHEPALGLHACNTTHETAALFGGRVGVLVSAVPPDSILGRAGLREDDLIHTLRTVGATNLSAEPLAFGLDRFGTSWNGRRGCSQKLENLIGSVDFGTTLELDVARRDGEGVRDAVVRFVYDTGNDHQIRHLHVPYETPTSYRLMGLTVEPLRMNHIESALCRYHPGLLRYAEPMNRHKWRLVLTAVDSGTPAFETSALVPGMILDAIDDRKIASFDDFRAALGAHRRDAPVKLRFEGQRPCTLFLQG